MATRTGKSSSSTIPGSPGETMRKLRNQRGMKGKQLAEEAHLSPHYISKIELSKNSPSLKARTAIAKALEVDVTDIWPSQDNSWVIDQTHHYLQVALESPFPTSLNIAVNGPTKEVTVTIRSDFGTLEVQPRRPSRPD